MVNKLAGKLVCDQQGEIKTCLKETLHLVLGSFN